MAVRATFAKLLPGHSEARKILNNNNPECTAKTKHLGFWRKV
jgi:hypothetical protein